MSLARRQSVRAVVVVAAVVAILVSLRSIYQENRRSEDLERARGTVRQQLEAFRDGDYKKAFTYAASSFHEQMSVAQFKKMVEDGYPHIARNREVRFGHAGWHGNTVDVEVTVTGEDGLPVPAVYSLQREADGWKVAGVSGPPPTPGPQEDRAPPKTPAGAA